MANSIIYFLQTQTNEDEGPMAEQVSEYDFYLTALQLGRKIGEQLEVTIDALFGPDVAAIYLRVDKAIAKLDA